LNNPEKWRQEALPKAAYISCPRKQLFIAKSDEKFLDVSASLEL